MDCSPPVCSPPDRSPALLCPWDSLVKNTGVHSQPFSRGSFWPGNEPTSLVSPVLVGGFFTISTIWGKPFQKWDNNIPVGENCFSPCLCCTVYTKSRPDRTLRMWVQGHRRPWVVSVPGHWKQGLCCSQSCNNTLWGATTSSCVNLGSLLYLGCVSVSSSIEWGSC